MSEFGGMLFARIEGLEEVKKKLAKLPDEVEGDVVIAVANYLLNVMVNEEVPAYKYVSRKSAYGKTFFTDKQRRWFWWAVREGLIEFPVHYVRRGKNGGVASQWKILNADNPQKTMIVNEADASPYLYDDNYQARQLGMVGWPKLGSVLQRRRKNIQSVMMRATKRAIKKLGLA